MSESVMNYKCPCCGASLAYDGKSGKLACASCGNEYDTETLGQAESALNDATQKDALSWKREGDGEWSADESAHMRRYACPSCGAEIVTDDTTTATECVYCGNASILPSQMQGNFRPDAILPFVKTKEDAQKAYRALIKGKRLLPDEFASKKRIDSIQGVYVPFWLFDCDADAKVAYRAEKRHIRRTSSEEITDIEHYLLLRAGSLGFENVPVDGSSKFDDTLMEAIEPYDYSQCAEFSTAYMPGYQAERYDVDADASQPRADERVTQSVGDTFAATATGYDSVSVQSSNIQLAHGMVKNVLLPVWMLNMQWKKKNYVFAMNGQTGKLVGNLPVSRGKAWKWRLGLFFSTFAAGMVILWALCAMGVL